MSVLAGTSQQVHFGRKVVGNPLVAAAGQRCTGGSTESGSWVHVDPLSGVIDK